PRQSNPGALPRPVPCGLRLHKARARATARDPAGPVHAPRFRIAPVAWPPGPLPTPQARAGPRVEGPNDPPAFVFDDAAFHASSRVALREEMREVASWPFQLQPPWVFCR